MLKQVWLVWPLPSLIPSCILMCLFSWVGWKGDASARAVVKHLALDRNKHMETIKCCRSWIAHNQFSNYPSTICRFSLNGFTVGGCSKRHETPWERWTSEGGIIGKCFGGHPGMLPLLHLPHSPLHGILWQDFSPTVEAERWPTSHSVAWNMLPLAFLRAVLSPCWMTAAGGPPVSAARSFTAAWVSPPEGCGFMWCLLSSLVLTGCPAPTTVHRGERLPLYWGRASSYSR